MATRSAMPTFDSDASAELTLLFWGGTTATGTMMGQVESFDWTNTKEKRETYRVGDSSKYRDYTAENVTWNLSLFEDNDLADEARVMGFTKPTAGGWTTASASMGIATTDATTTVTLARYNGEATGSTLLWVETLSAVSVESMQHTVKSNETNKWTFSGEAANVVLTPETGMGAST